MLKQETFPVQWTERAFVCVFVAWGRRGRSGYRAVPVSGQYRSHFTYSQTSLAATPPSAGRFKKRIARDRKTR
jgi:hypothetical protein